MGATDPLSESTNAQIILDFKMDEVITVHIHLFQVFQEMLLQQRNYRRQDLSVELVSTVLPILIFGVNTTGNQNTTGNAATATKLQTARTIGGVSFDGTANINLRC